MFFRILCYFSYQEKKSYLAEGGNIVKQNDTHCTMDDTLQQPNRYFMCVCARVDVHIHTSMHTCTHTYIWVYVYTHRKEFWIEKVKTRGAWVA